MSNTRKARNSLTLCVRVRVPAPQAIVKLDITDIEVLRALARGATIAVTIREKRKVAEVEVRRHAAACTGTLYIRVAHLSARVWSQGSKMRTMRRIGSTVCTRECRSNAHLL